MGRRSARFAFEQETDDNDEEVTGVRIRRYRPEAVEEHPAEEGPVEDPRDTLLRQILGALNRSRIMCGSQREKAKREFKAYCSQYKSVYGHLNIPTSLPLHLTRRPT